MPNVDTLLAIVCLALPAVVLLVLVWRWLAGRGRGTPGISETYIPAPPVVSEVIQAVSRVADAAVTPVYVLQTATAAQIGQVAHIAVEAIGYVLARLTGQAGAPLITLTRDGQTLHLVAAQQAYQLNIAFQARQPASYAGADVKPTPLAGPAQFEVRLEGAAVDTTWQGEPVLRLAPGLDSAVNVTVRPRQAGPASLRVQLFQDNAWSQQLDLKLEVHPLDAMTALRAAPGARAVGALEASNTLSLVPNLRPRQVHLSIAYAPGEVEGRVFRAMASDGKQWRELELPLLENDLAEENTALWEALARVQRFIGNEVDGAKVEADEPGYRKTLEDLAWQGRLTWHRIFPRDEDRDFILQALARAQEPALEISTDHFFVPWELLYEGGANDPVDVKNFWGFRFQLSRVLTDVRQKLTPIITVQVRPRVTLFANVELDSVRETEAPYFRNLQLSQKIQLTEWEQVQLPEPEPLSEPELSRRRFAYACQQESDVAHFACHAVVDTKYGPRSYLTLSSDLRILLGDLQMNTNYRLAGAPFVVLNACGTAVRDPLKTSDFVRRFMLNGGRGVLATECDVPDRFAGLFIQQLYDQWLGEAPLGTVLLAARRHFLQEHQNPLGLLYAAYAPFEIQLQRRPSGPPSPRPGETAPTSPKEPLPRRSP
jgi:CHAT domain